MKRLLRPVALVLVMTLLAGGAYGLSGGDSLVSLRYLTETFFPQAVQVGEEAADRALEETYDRARDRLVAVQGGQTGESAGGLYSETLQQREWSDGQTITLTTGAGLLMLQGAATATHAGAVVDVTDGTELPSGGMLASGHRYLVGEGTTAQITVLSGYATLGVQGGYALSGGVADPTPFFDVSRNDWFYEPVGYAYENGLFSGLEEHRFGPNEPMTRAMLMTVLYQLAGAPEEELNGAQVQLTDVADGMWYAPYVRWGVAQGIATGTGDGAFNPDGRVTREQLAVLLYSFGANYLGVEMSLGADLSPYGDLEESSTWARQALSWAVAEGIISSTSGTERLLSPQRNASRAEVATMLRAFAEKI